MKVHDWHRNGLRPVFATVEQWISDQLGFVGAEDMACFATELRPETARAGLAVRILVERAERLQVHGQQRHLLTDVVVELPGEP